MNITFGLHCDGLLAAPLKPRFGECTVGPHGFLAVLETQLGLPVLDAPLTARQITYLDCLARFDAPERFYHESFAHDRFSVARTLLRWRDIWYEGGWRGGFTEDVPARLRDMSDVEHDAVVRVAPGAGQRLQRVIRELGSHRTQFARVTLVDAWDVLPPVWQRLLVVLRDHHACEIVLPSDERARAQEGSDLHTLQRLLLDGPVEPAELRGDGSVVVITSDSLELSAQVTALVVASARSWNHEVALVSEIRGAVLDDALAAQGIPRRGFDSASPWRPVFQVLPLAFDILWAPLDPVCLLQFLGHPVGPLPRALRQKLTAVVADQPGVDGEMWRDAVKGYFEEHGDKLSTERRAAIDEWLCVATVPLMDGMTIDVAIRRATLTESWLVQRLALARSDAEKCDYSAGVAQARDLVEALHELQRIGVVRLTRESLRHLLEEVRGRGARRADAFGETDPLRCELLVAEHPNAVLGTPDTLVWWDCQPGPGLVRYPWFPQERRVLAAEGVELWSEDAQWRWQAASWMRPLLQARQQVVLCFHDDAEARHPIWDQVSALCSGIPEHVLDTQLFDRPALALATGTVVLDGPVLAQRALPGPRRWWRLPEGVTLPARERESYSSLEPFLYSPYQWVLRYASRLRAGALAEVSDGNRLKGNLAHRLFQDFFQAHPDPGRIAVPSIGIWVQTRLPDLLAAEGALLLRPGRLTEKEAFLSTLIPALQALVTQLQAARVVTVAMEVDQADRFRGGALEGSIDMLVTNADGHEAVIDIKYSGLKYRRTDLQEGQYLQLAIYAHLRRQAAGSWPALAYFIVDAARLLAADCHFFPSAEVVASNADESSVALWQRVEATWAWRRAQLDAGQIEVTVGDTEPDDGSQPGTEGLVIPDANDRFNEFAVLTGWGEAQ